MDIKRVAAIVGGLLVACSDGTGPRGGVDARYTAIPDDSAVVLTDSLQVTVPAGVAWSAIHGAAAWLELVDTAGSGSGWLRWRRDNATLVPGLYVDTIVIARGDGLAGRIFIDSLEIVGEPAQYIVRRRAWLPGERDAQVAAVIANNGLWAYSSLAPTLLPLDSITEVIPNPAYHAPATARGLNFSLHSPTSGGMTVTGIDLWVVDTTTPPQVQSDTTQWLMVFWYNGTDPTYKGFLAIFSRTATRAATTINTTNWDAVNGTAGGGGGEIRPGTGEYWEGTAGSLRITANSARTAAGSTITSGPFTGGTQRNGLMGGRIQNVILTRILPSPGGNQTVNLDFRTSQIPASRLECVFNFPCTSVAAAPLLAALRRGDVAAAMGLPPRP